MRAKSAVLFYRELADEARNTLESLRRWYGEEDPDFPRKVVEALGDLMTRALEGGGFAGPDRRRFELLVAEMKELRPEHWRESAFVGVVHLLPELGAKLAKGRVRYEEVFAALANRFDAEADKLEAPGRKRPKRKPGPKGARYDTEKDNKDYEGWQAYKRNSTGRPTIADYAKEKYGVTDWMKVAEIRATIERVAKRKWRMPAK